MHPNNPVARGALTRKDSDDSTQARMGSPPPPPPPQPAAAQQQLLLQSSATAISPQSFVSRQWNKAAKMLKNHPSLVTQHILCLALRHRPPKEIIDFMLQLNPKAAAIPKSGPSPLQVAIEHNSSAAVIQSLIQACPLALVATNPGSYMDPLSYARRFRSGEKELIKLLSLPLSHWLSVKTTRSSSNNKNNAKKKANEDEEDVPLNNHGNNFWYKPKASKPTALPFVRRVNYGAAASAGSSGRRTATLADTQELNNMKIICMSVLKGHKRLSKQVKALEQQQQTNPEEQHALLLRQLAKQQQKHFRIQLIALDMKEQAMRAHVRRMERRMVQSCRQAVQQQQQQRVVVGSAITALQSHLQGFQRRLSAVERRLENRKNNNNNKVDNSPLANNNNTTQQRSSSKKQQRSSPKVQATTTPIIFATPVIEVTRDDDCDDDEVRSLLSEESQVHRNNKASYWRRPNFWMCQRRSSLA